MNAQEAIERIERLIEFHNPNTEITEPLSIVLESAKLFHEYSVPELFSYLQKNLGDEEVKKVETIYGEPIGNLGIDVKEFVDEEGADE